MLGKRDARGAVVSCIAVRSDDGGTMMDLASVKPLNDAMQEYKDKRLRLIV